MVLMSQKNGWKVAVIKGSSVLISKHTPSIACKAHTSTPVGPSGTFVQIRKRCPFFDTFLLPAGKLIHIQMKNN